jgi:hypothetical protein
MSSAIIFSASVGNSRSRLARSTNIDAPNFLIRLWTQPFFHAYLGYQVTHIQGIEADLARISGVRSRIFWVNAEYISLQNRWLATIPVVPCIQIPITEPVAGPHKVENARRL